MTINPGDRIPSWCLENQFGELVDADDVKVGRSLLVFFPWAFSRVCGAELDELQREHAFFTEAKVRVCGISVDHKFALRSYAQDRGVEFELLADFWPHGAVARQFDAFDDERGVATRHSYFVVDGIVREVISSPLSTVRAFSDYRAAIETHVTAH
ncbi:redoxin domain-containing protein [Glutamicibacter sp. PS]|uniref:redoxin domain-containing protein n=1 Tax=Glutamicibacter sp. PS TaxID=3075634 RepID=UPI0028411611|nr:redoxin domain-containing protein [Glutamicibacter sp. PS]MDR4532904.1 redoxin domain-containing protein [Glutamicibacter sp. PS]